MAISKITNDGIGDIDELTVDTNTLVVDSTNNRVGVGTSTPSQKLDVSGAGARIYLNDANEDIDMNSTADGQLRLDGSGYAGAIALNTVGMNIYTNASSRGIIFGTNETERMRIDSSGRVLIRQTSAQEAAALCVDADAFGIAVGTDTALTTLRYHYIFRNGNGQVGGIYTNGSGTAFSTSSDYRLKENAVAISDGITRVKSLQPKRFNFIADDSTTVDGFMAHEAQIVVPEAVHGTHNEVETWTQDEIDAGDAPANTSAGDNKLDGDGNTIPVYQGIDQSKLVPLLTAALQEAITKIEALETQNADFETRIAALEAN